MKYITPSVNNSAFNCPHCGVLTTQYWFEVWAKQISGDKKTPVVINELNISDYENLDHVQDDDFRNKLLKWVEKMYHGEPFIEEININNHNIRMSVPNINLSHCYNCQKISVWVHDKLVFPMSGEAPIPNADMPDDIRRDYLEASAISNLSPRGAAALLRLGIQKLCIFLKKPGKNINDDIASLVRDGLDARVQKALDTVRVIGNDAVHPGQIDLRDDRDTAESLFRLMNIIVEKMISEPKHIDEMYESLPEGKRRQIEKRDGRDA